jgi:acetoacetyl-CoA synthetase
MEDAAPLWAPSAARIESSQLRRFQAAAASFAGRELASYDDLHHWSVTEPGAFWRTVWDFTGVIASRRSAIALADGDQFPGARWFPDARLNYAENLLRYRDDQPALIGCLEFYWVYLQAGH